MPFSALTAYGAQPTITTGHTPSGIPFSELENRIDTFVAEHLGETTPGVAIAVVYNGEIIFSKGYGYADIEQGIPIDPATTIMAHGSISKVFVWTAAMQLVEQGLLDLDVDITTYLSEEARRQFAFEMPFTMRDLMNHSAGFEEFIHDFIHYDTHNLENLGLRVSLLANQPMQIFTPGTASAYSNWGTTLAAYVIENISGQNFADFEMENILVPAGIANTLSEPHWSNNQPFLQAKTVGYQPDGRGGFRETPILYFGGFYPAGGVVGTAEDLARFIKALTPPIGEAGLLFENADTLEVMFSSSSPDPISHPTTHHGLFRYDGMVSAFGHGGDTTRSSANFAVVPEERFGWVVLSNAASELNIRYGLSDLLIGNTMNQVQPLTYNLPNATAVEGRFVPLRRIENNLLEFQNYLGLYRINAIDENTIQLSLGAWNATYLQVEPYVFHIISASNPFFNAMLNELHFVMENDRPVQVIIPNGMNLSSLPQGRTMPFLVAYLLVLIICVLFFFITSVVLLLKLLVNRAKGKAAGNQTRFRFFSVGLLVSGLLLLLNNIVALVSGFANHTIFTSAGINPYIGANYVIVVLAAAVFVLSIILFQKKTVEITTRSKVFYGVTTMLLVLLVLTLHSWNFFVFL